MNPKLREISICFLLMQIRRATFQNSGNTSGNRIKNESVAQTVGKVKFRETIT